MGFDSRQVAKVVTPRSGDTLEDIAAREQAAGNDVTAEQIAKFNFGTDRADEINEFLRDELGARHRDARKNFTLSPDDRGRSQLLVPKKFEKQGLATGRMHTLRVVSKTAPPQFLECCSIPGITFEFDKSFIRPTVVGALKALEEAVGRNPDAKIMIWGHTDKVGSESYNKLLSERRAKSVFAFIVNDVNTWEQLAAHPNEQWGRNEDNQMLADQGFDPATNPNAVRDYQTARGLNPDGIVGPITRRQLITDYMSGKHDLQITADQFMDPKHMGCGEFNPKVETDAANEDNRRVTFFLFHKDRLPVLPCPTTPGDLAPCKRQIAASGPRHVASFKCSFFDSIAFKCQCENPGPPPATPTIALQRIETSDPVAPGATPVFRADDDFSPTINERARFTIQLNNLTPGFTGKVAIDIGRLTNRPDDPATADVNEAFTRVARIEADITATAATATVQIEWDGKATQAVPRELSNRTTRNHNTGADVPIPLNAIASGAAVTHGLYVVDQVTLLEGTAVRARQRPRDADLSVPVLANLRFNANWPADLRAFGLAPFQAQLEEGLRRYGTRDYQHRAADVRNRINVRFLTDATLTNGNSFLIAIGGNRADGLFGSTPAGPAPLADNPYVFGDALGGDVDVFPGTFMLFNTAGGAIGPTDQADFRRIFAPLGVAAGANAGAPGVATARAVDGAGAVTGACDATDSGNVTVTLDADGMATVATNDPAVVPPARAADIQRALRAFVRFVGNTTNHELGHALSLVTRIRADNQLTISGVTLTSPLNGDGGGHNRVTAATNIMDAGGTRSFTRRIELTGVVQVFNAANMQLLRDCIPFDRTDN